VSGSVVLPALLLLLPAMHGAAALISDLITPQVNPVSLFHKLRIHALATF
jgi:hypothetical protein